MTSEVLKTFLDYTDTEGNVYEGVVCKPGNLAGKVPAVMVLHAFGGCGEFEISKAEQLAKLGYIAFAADLYGKKKRGTTIAENMALVRPLVATRGTLLKERLLSSLATIKSIPEVDSDKIAAIGYCFGGLCALDLARHQTGILAAVSFHGTLTPLEGIELKNFVTTIQVHHGSEDTHISNETVAGFEQEMRDRQVDWSLTSYGKAVHGFTEPHADSFGLPGLKYNKEADIRSWAATIALLQEKLQ